MKYSEGTRRLQAYRKRIEGLRQRMRKVQKAVEPQAVDDYTFSTMQGRTRVSKLFGAHKELFVVHNMGSSCAYCTLWADGYNGIYPHLADRAAFVVSSPDSPAVQRRVARRRGWQFPMVSHQGTTFAADMGYRAKDGGWRPGISVLRRERQRIVRLSDTEFSPSDDFCALWRTLDLLPEGPAGWQPKLKYPGTRRAGRR